MYFIYPSNDSEPGISFDELIQKYGIHKNFIYTYMCCVCECIIMSLKYSEIIIGCVFHFHKSSMPTTSVINNQALEATKSLWK